MAQPPLVIVGGWQRKSLDMSIHSKDRLITAVNKGFDAMAAVLDKDSDPVDVHSILTYLNAERSIALKFDKAKDDSLRELVYGLLESLHVSLTEWTEERNQKKETGENSTQTEEECALSLALIPSNGASLPIDNNSSNILAIIPNISPSFPIEPKEEPIDIHQPLPNDYQISASEIMRDEKMSKKEEMDDNNKEGITPHSNPIFPDSLDLLAQSLNFTPSLPFNSIGEPTDISQTFPHDNQMPPLNALGKEMEFMGEDMPNDNVNSGMGEVCDDDSRNASPFNDDDSTQRTMQPSEVMDYQMNFGDSQTSGDRDLPQSEKKSLNEVSASIKDVDETAEPEKYGEQVDVLATDQNDNEGDDEINPTDTRKGNSDTPTVEKKRRSSRPVFRPMKYNESPDNSDGEDGPSMKKSRMESTRKVENKRISYKREDKSEAVIRKRVSKANDTELECPECELRTRSICSWMAHLRKKHSTTPALAGLALRCECGNESLSDDHSRVCDGNVTVIIKRDGPIRRLNDEKATPQCVLCEMYPKTAYGYALHLYRHHKSSLAEKGIFLKCSCGIDIRSNNAHLKHPKECDPRQFTLHRLDDE